MFAIFVWLRYNKDGGQRIEDRSQRSEDRGQKTEVCRLWTMD